MGLEAEYKNPRIVLTLAVTERYQETVRAIKCISVVLITYHLAVFEFRESLLLSISILIFMIAMVMLLFARPSVTMDIVAKSMEITGMRESGGTLKLHAHEVRKVSVQSRRAGHLFGGKDDGQAKRFFPRLYVQQKRGKKTNNMVVDCFEMEDANEATYAAMLVAAFTRANAFDANGQICTPLRSPIPAKYLKNPEEASGFVSTEEEMRM